MARISKKQMVLRRLDELITTATKRLIASTMMGLGTADIEVLLHGLPSLESTVKENRYLCSRGPYRRRCQKFDLYLRTDHDNRLNDREFKFHFRVTRECFRQLVVLLEDHSAFKKRSSDTRGRDPKPASHQLLVLLKYFGSEGNSASSLAIGTFFGIGSGAVEACKERALEALLSLENRTYISLIV
jgi:hypothetical protein